MVVVKPFMYQEMSQTIVYKRERERERERSFLYVLRNTILLMRIDVRHVNIRLLNKLSTIGSYLVKSSTSLRSSV